MKATATVNKKGRGYLPFFIAEEKRFAILGIVEQTMKSSLFDHYARLLSAFQPTNWMGVFHLIGYGALTRMTMRWRNSI